MALWFTSDLHFGHGNIIRYSSRPFADVAAMDRALVERWNDTVAAADDVWILGDFALGRIEATLPLAEQLQGRKHLLSGNHDRCWSGHGPRARAWVPRYQAVGLEVRQGELELEVAGTAVLACHFPYQGDSHGQDRYVDARPVDRGRWLLHGHVHGRWRQRDRMINVGVDAWGYRPVSADELGRLIADGPGRRAPISVVM
jgi:calcineurin-like phosphoesterase family protein